jgi:hypothetical protein
LATSIARLYPRDAAEGKHPRFDLHIVDGCRHLVPRGTTKEVARLAMTFLKI